MRKTHFNAFRRLEPGLMGIGTFPAFAIGQRALMLRTPSGNILWDCVSFLDDTTVTIVTTPGHTPGHMSFIDTRDRSLIAGDAFTSYVRAEVPNRLLQPFPLATMGTQDREQVVDSARALRRLEPAIPVMKKHTRPATAP